MEVYLVIILAIGSAIGIEAANKTGKNFILVFINSNTQFVTNKCIKMQLFILLILFSFEIYNNLNGFKLIFTQNISLHRHLRCQAYRLSGQHKIGL